MFVADREIWHHRRIANIRRLLDVYQVPGFRPKAKITGVFGDPTARVIRLERRQKKQCAGGAARGTGVTTTARRGLSGTSSCGDARIYLAVAVRRVSCRRCGKVKRERLNWLSDNPFYTKRFVVVCRAAVPRHEHPGRGQGSASGLAYR